MGLETVIAVVSAIISSAALFVTLYDRRPHLSVRRRKGDWYKLDQRGSECLFRGVVEVYNWSSRANAIENYEFWARREGGDWEKMESEYYKSSSKGEVIIETFNVTPLLLGPYSGVEARVSSIAKSQRPAKLGIRIEIEDLFGRLVMAGVDLRTVQSSS